MRLIDADNPYWNNVCAIAERQRAKGLATYGQGIEKNPADIIKRIEYLEEELVDALMYCEWIKDGIKNTVSVVRCKDCQKWNQYGPGGLGTCHRCDISGTLITHGDEFCSSGERRDKDGEDD